jgi:glyoxylase-like metal-dependent hydrolase (beta-lactamase superfamily II)
MGFEEALAKVGLRTTDIKTVVQTHLMYDHCANSPSLDRARFVVQKEELDFALSPHPLLAGAYQRQFFQDLNFEVVEGDCDLAPGIRLLFTPGHTPGIQSVAVETADGLAVITGFCCLAENFDPRIAPAWKTDLAPEVIPPGIHIDMAQAYESMLRVKRMAKIIIPFHDPVMTAKACIPE